MPRPSLKKRSDGRYCCKYKGKPFYGHTSSEAYAARDAYKRDIEAGLRHEAAGITVKEYAARWLPVHRHNACKKSYDLYARALGKLVKSVGADARMRDITKSDITAFYNTLDRYSQSQINKHVTTIRGMFADAVDDGIILRNPCKDVQKPDGTSGTHRAIEPWEREIVHQLADTHPFGAAAMLMLYAGLRRGEALAFDVDRDVDFDAGRVYVREAISYTEDFRGLIGDTKTAAGVRDLPLFAPLRACLEGKHGRAVKPVKTANMTESAFKSAWSSYLFAAGVIRNNGRRPRWIGKTKEDKALLKANPKHEFPPWVPVKMQTHDFRHSFCTMICDAGVDIKTAMAWMGHSDEAMIRKIYDHLSEARKKTAEKNTAALIDRMLKKS